MQTISALSLYCDGSYHYFIFDNVELNMGQRNQEKAVFKGFTLCSDKSYNLTS